MHEYSYLLSLSISLIYAISYLCVFFCYIFFLASSGFRMTFKIHLFHIKKLEVYEIKLIAFTRYMHTHPHRHTHDKRNLIYCLFYIDSIILKQNKSSCYFFCRSIFRRFFFFPETTIRFFMRFVGNFYIRCFVIHNKLNSRFVCAIKL